MGKLISAGMSRKSAKQKNKAVLEAQKQTLAAIGEERDRLAGASGEMAALNQHLSQGISNRLNEGFRQGADITQSYGQGAMSQLGSGLQGQMSALQGGYGQASNTLAQAAGNQLGALDLSGFETSPGYQFRQQQGEGAINRLASARGGRLSGRTLQELSSFNQGLAADEFDKYRQQQLAARGQDLGARGQDFAMAQGQANMLAQGGQAMGDASAAGGEALSNAQLSLGQNMANLALGRGQALAGATQNQLSNALNIGANQNSLSAALLGAQTGAIQMPIATAGGTAAAGAQSAQDFTLGKALGEVGQVAQIGF